VPRWPPAHSTRHPHPPAPIPTATSAASSGPPDPDGDRLARLPEVLTVREVAAILRVGRNQLYHAVACGEVPAIRIGRTIRIPTTTLLAMLTPSRQLPTALADE
jgi:excisionase family DNA binding protein